MAKEKAPKTGAVVLRIILFANLIAITAYGAVSPHQMYKVPAECATIGIAALAMTAQTYVTLSVFTCLPYSIWLVIGIDWVCAAGWVAAIAILSYWDRQVVYMPHSGDPNAWLKCANTHNWDQVLTSDGFGSWIKILWCEIEVDGKSRLVGNGAARQQLHVLIGLSTVSLLFTDFIILWTWRRALYLGLIKRRTRTSPTRSS